MISPKQFFNCLKSENIFFFSGVPDSLLADFCAYLEDNVLKEKHIIAANEGNALAIATGYYLATEKFPVVYMQNSGLGNIINPITSLTDSEVYKIPILLIIGWRGEPGIKDEPQHVKQGKITESQLKLLGIPFLKLNSNSDPNVEVKKAINLLKETNSPVALLVSKNTFSTYKVINKLVNQSKISREEAITEILSFISMSDLVISTTGKASREVFQFRKSNNQPQRDFLTVGSMGHASSIALGVAIATPKKKVICLDGDGALLMHMGSLAIIASIKPKNFIHVLLNNSCHESVGGQPTVANNIDFKKLSKSLGYISYFFAENKMELQNILIKYLNKAGPMFIEIRIKKGSRDNLARPASTPEENKLFFMEQIKKL